MKRRNFMWLPAGALLLTAALNPSVRAQVLTLQFGAGSLPPVPLVNHGDTWRFHIGSNAPVVGWQTNAEVALDPVLWGSGPGGFGFEDGDDATVLNVMSNRYTTVYIRRSFDITEPADASRHIQLVMDYDDGFVAWLDGVEIARSPNAPTNAEPPYTATSFAPNHEASAGANGNPPTVLDLGLAGSRLQPGTRTLAILGLNGGITSSDLSLIADLSLTGGSSTVSGGNFFTLVTTSPITMSGSNTFPGSARVSINGVDAAFNPAADTWTKSQPLSPGLNRLFIAALDANGAILAATNHDVIYEAASVSVGGTLAGNTTWNSAAGIVRVTSDVIVPSGVTLDINEGVVVLLPSGVRIRATAGGTINANGTEAAPCFFLPSSGSGNWTNNATGVGASLNIRHIETAGGAITFNNQANGLIEDSYLHDCGPILIANGAGSITTRRIHVKNYDETIYNSSTLVLAEDSLYEGLFTANSDALEIQGGVPGSIVRRCTFRRSIGGNSDAVDFNGTSGALIDSCLIHDFTDKAISLGAAGAGGANDNGIVITNCLIYNVDTGIAVKDNGTASLYDTTVSQCVIGLSLYQKFTTPIGGGHITNGYNNVIWGNGTSISATEGGTVTTDYSDVQGGVWPGTGNIDADPLFVDTGRGDFRVGAGSPAEQASASGGPIGIHNPVGGLPSAPFELAALVSNGNSPIQLTWQEDADNESGFALQRSVDGTTWTDAGDFGRDVTNVVDNITLPDMLYFFRVRATNSSGFSRYSNLASAIRRTTATVVSGPLSGDTIWSPSLGEIHVVGNVTVPNGVTLTIQPGTVIKLTNTTSIRASAGGTISVNGTEPSPALFTTLNGTNVWSELAADGASSFLTIRHAEIIGGAVKLRNGATGLLEDTYVHNYKSGTVPIAGCTSASSVTVRRCHFAYYHETLWQFTPMLVEDSLFENADNPSSDALDFDGAPPGSVIRRCTFRHGPRTNTDAVDIGSVTSGVLIQDCLMYDFPNDKGVTIGDFGSISLGTVITNCLIYGCDAAVGVKDTCTVGIYNCTFANNNYGFHAYNKPTNNATTGGGRITNSFNNILWGNLDNVGLFNGGTALASYSDIGVPNVVPVPGDFVTSDDISADPLFVNSTLPLGKRDYRLLPGSPCLGTGRNGENMGARLPVGAPMAPSNPYISALSMAGGNAVVGFWADSERTYSLESSPNVAGGPWTSIATVSLNPVPRYLTVTNSLAAGGQFFRLVSP